MAFYVYMDIWEAKKGGYYDPPYSAECQISKKSGLSLTLPRSLEFFFRPPFDRRFDRRFIFFVFFDIKKCYFVLLCVYKFKRGVL